jgi:hypothetical protein
MVGTASPVSNGVYTEALAWKSAPAEDDRQEPSTLPADAFWLQGHDGQSIAVVPSEGLVVVRLGLTPAKMNYHPQALVAKVMEAAREPLPDAPTDNVQPKDDSQPSEDAVEPD